MSATTAPRRVARRPRIQPGGPTRSGGKTEALPGRPRGAALIHCVFGKRPDRQGTGATRVPLGYADLDRPGEVRGAFFFAGDVHNDVHKLTWDVL